MRNKTDNQKRKTDPNNVNRKALGNRLIVLGKRENMPGYSEKSIVPGKSLISVAASRLPTRSAPTSTLLTGNASSPKGSDQIDEGLKIQKLFLKLTLRINPS